MSCHNHHEFMCALALMRSQGSFLLAINNEPRGFGERVMVCTFHLHSFCMLFVRLTLSQKIILYNLKYFFSSYVILNFIHPFTVF